MDPDDIDNWWTTTAAVAETLFYQHPMDAVWEGQGQGAAPLRPLVHVRGLGGSSL